MANRRGTARMISERASLAAGPFVSFDELGGALVGNRWWVESEEVDITGTFSSNPARSFSGSTSNGLTISGSAGSCR